MNNEMTLTEICEDTIKKYCKDYLICIPENQSPLDLVRKTGRQQEFVKIRQFIIRWLRDEHSWSFPRIGRLLNRDHTSIIHLYYKK